MGKLNPEPSTSEDFAILKGESKEQVRVLLNEFRQNQMLDLVRVRKQQSILNLKLRVSRA